MATPEKLRIYTTMIEGHRLLVIAKTKRAASELFTRSTGTKVAAYDIDELVNETLFRNMISGHVFAVMTPGFYHNGKYVGFEIQPYEMLNRVLV